MSMIICDIDGTIADCEHRRHYITSKPKDHDAFYAGVRDDKPIGKIIGVLLSLIERDQYTVTFVTGRRERTRKDTEWWLSEYLHLYPYDYEMYMRKDKDYRQDYMVKQDILDKHIDKSKVWIVLDDRDQVVQMWRRNGLTCLQVAEGNF
jgi:FMN phosphatase YigB (HAD superfamily)